MSSRVPVFGEPYKTTDAFGWCYCCMSAQPVGAVMFDELFTDGRSPTPTCAPCRGISEARQRAAQKAEERAQEQRDSNKATTSKAPTLSDKKHSVRRRKLSPEEMP